MKVFFRQRENLIAAIAVFFLALTLFGRSVFFDFVNIDDNSNLNKNPAMRDLSLAWSKPYLDAYLPVVYTVWNGLHHLAVAERSSGDTPETFTPIPELEPLPFHAVNVLLHAINGLLLFMILRRLFASLPVTIPGLLSCLFVAHPLQVEAVAWVTALKDVLSATFSLLLLFYYLQHPLSDYRGRQNFQRIALLSVIFLLACLTKSTRIFLPLFLVPCGHLYWRKPVVRLLAELWPLFLVALLVMVIALVVQPPPKYMAYQELWRRPFVAADSLAFYLWKLCWPLSLTLDYGRNPRFLFETGMVWQVSWIPVLLAAGWWFCRRKIDRWLQLGVAGFVLGLLPLLGLQPFVFQTISTVSDRYCYLSIALLLIGIAPVLGQVKQKTPVIFVLVALLTAFSARTFLQLGAWQNSYTLWQHNLEVTPDSGLAHNNLASIYEILGQPAAAIAHYEASFVRLPNADLCARIAILYTDLQQWQQALVWIDKGLQLDSQNEILQHNRAVVLQNLQQRTFRLSH